MRWHGIALITEDRKGEGLLLSQSISANIALGNMPEISRAGVVNNSNEISLAQRQINAMRIRSSSPAQLVSELSGGNQQKVVIGRWLERDCSVLLFDEPTRGIDVGAKFDIYALLGELTRQGKALVVVSSDLRELMLICDRIGVLSAGRLIDTFERDSWTQDDLLAAAFAGYQNVMRCSMKQRLGNSHENCIFCRQTWWQFLRSWHLPGPGGCLAGDGGAVLGLSSHFLSYDTFSTLANQIPDLMVLAVGMTFVLIIGGIDLSVGSVLALAASTVSVAILGWGWSVLPSALLGMAVAALAGTITGSITVAWRIPSFIVSLGVLEMARGLAYQMTGSRTAYIGDSFAWLSNPIAFGISPSFIIALLVIFMRKRC
jgi:ABC-type branched-subunit amino acid transport system ATPase component